ncbi:MAG: OmpA family protein [Gammaproteobacteria bacterium]|nr:OmpA family protein [Gammaproteobacteria bacterium]
MRTATKNFLISSIVAVISLVATNGVLAAGGITNNHAYVVDGSGTLVRDGSGKCIRTGSWSQEHALVECGDAVAAAPPMAEKAPEAPVAAGPKPAAIRATLQTDAFFDFDKAVVKAEGKAKLDDFVTQMNQHKEVDVLLVTGHTDRIGTNSYNMKLSQRRADAVKNYLVEKGVSSNRIETAAKGEEEPVVSCDGVKGRTALIDCLAPNRRVVVETKVQREN